MKKQILCVLCASVIKYKDDGIASCYVIRVR